MAQKRLAAAKAPDWVDGIPTRGGIDGDAVWDDATESAKEWTATKFAESPSKFPQLAGLFAKLGQYIAVATLGRVIDLEKRLSNLEAVKGLDAQVFDEFTECLRRVDKMESDLSERSISYRGYWRSGMTAKRGDAVTEDGSLWIAVRATDDKPNTHSADWCLGARKGRDAN